MVLGDTSPAAPGMALVDSKSFLRMTGQAMESILEIRGEVIWLFCLSRDLRKDMTISLLMVSVLLCSQAESWG